MKKTFKLSGLDCASCSLAIESALDQVSGIKQCQVNDKEKLLDVEFDEQAVKPEQIIRTIHDAGFEAEE